MIDLLRQALQKLNQALDRLGERLELAQKRKQIGTRIDLEREWLAELVRLKAGLQAGRQAAGALTGLPRRLGRWMIENVKSIGTSRPASRPLSLQAWILRGTPLVAILLLILAVYHRLPEPAPVEEPFDIFTTAPHQRILVVHDTTDPFSEIAYQNTAQALTYAHLTFDDLDLAAGGPWPDLSQYSALLFVAERLVEIDEARAGRIRTYVFDGGGLAVIYRGWHPHLADLFGLAEGQGRPPLLPDSEGGWQFQADLFPGLEGLVLGPEAAAGHVPYEVQLQPQVEVIARSVADRPLAWRRRYGQGRVLFWNTARLAGKNARGLIVQSVTNVQRVSLLPIANAAVIQIDDFPAGLPETDLEPIKSEYDLDPVEFYSQVWYPDMLDLAHTYGLAYTFLIPFNYNDQTGPPFDFRDWASAGVTIDGQTIPYGRYAAHIAGQRDELGLHGYNHVPLTLENWGSQGRMIAALEATARRWGADSLGPRPVAYVPPHNRYDAAGAQALTEAFPSLRVISGLYHSGAFEEGGDREFGPEPWNPRLFALPRATAGYNMDSVQRLAMVSEVGTLGLWTHFLHADDVFETPENFPQAAAPRNAAGWFWRGDHIGQQNGFYYRFRRWLNFARDAYPWLRYVHTAEAHEILSAYLANRVTVDLKPYALTMRTQQPTYFQVRINDGRRLDLRSTAGAQFVHLHQGDGYKIYTLRSVRNRVDLPLLIPEVGE